jgi:formylglycine-generating enzyme required for sulfatase activity
VKITQPFYLGLYEVTQAEYLQVTGTNPSKFKGGGSAAVHSVTWNEAVAFCRRLSALPKERAARRVYQLPSEAQWEYACRAGTTTVFYFGDDERGLGAYAWFADNSGGRTQPVGRKGPNAWGLFDMLGNASEWCADWFGDNYYRQSPGEDPAGPTAGEERVWRGGTFGHGYRVGFACAYRNDSPPDRREKFSGLRVMVPLGR